MLCKEIGVISGSEYFLNTPSKEAELLQYYWTSLGHYHCTSGYSIRRNFLPTLILIYIVQGELNLEYQDRRYCAKAGDVVLMDCTSAHFYYTANYLEFYWIHIEGANSYQMCRFLTEQNGVLFRSNRNTEIAEIMQLIISGHKNNQISTETENSIYIYRMLSCLMPDMRDKKHLGILDDIIEQTTQYIDEHLEDALSLKDLASNVNLSPSYFIRLFKKKTGCTPHEFVTQRRVSHAKHLLNISTLSVKQISSLVGFHSEQGFINAFQQRLGISPGKFRNSPFN